MKRSGMTEKGRLFPGDSLKGAKYNRMPFLVHPEILKPKIPVCPSVLDSPPLPDYTLCKQTNIIKLLCPKY